MMKHISSKENPLFKKILKLEKSKNRKTNQSFIIEGKKEVLAALKNNYEITELIFSESAEIDNELSQKISSIQNKYTLSNSLFKRITYRAELSECIAICDTPDTKLDNIKLSKNPLIIILEGVEKPGNLGAVLRSADGCAADAVIVCDERVDFYNPNVIRSSVGTVFGVQKATASVQDTIKWLNANNINTFTTFIENSKPYYKSDFNKPCAIVLGTEATGLSDLWRKSEFNNIVIPMDGENDSLNISVAAAVLMFEAKRQKTV